MEGLAVLFGILAVAGVFVLPIITICIINGLRGKVDDLSAEVGGLRRLLNADKKTEAPAPARVGDAIEGSRMPSGAVVKEAPPVPLVILPVPPPSMARKTPAPARVGDAVEGSRMQSSAVEKGPPPTHAWSPMAGVVPLDAQPEAPPFKWTDEMGKAAAAREAPAPARVGDAVEGSRMQSSAVEKEAPPREPSAAQSAVQGALSRAWNWIVVGEEFRRPGVAAEFAIATAWLVRVGVLVIVLAGGFLLQLSIARGVLGPHGRVSMSMLGGVALVLLGVRCMTRRLEMLGQGFVGGGLALFYFAFFAMYALFHLADVRVAFGGMILVTVSAVVLATRLGALSVAVFGIVGGYLTPVVLRTEHPNYSVLYLYLLLLALGMGGVAMRRQWPVLTWLCFVFNSLIFYFATGAHLGWTAGQGGAEHVAYLCGFFVLFSAAIVGYAVRYRVSATPLEVVSLFVNALVAFAFGAFLLGYEGAPQRMRLSFLALGMAAFYVAHIWGLLFYRRYDRVLVSGFIALVAIFLGVALPLIFTGHVLTCIFSLQALAFLWLGRRLNARMFLLGSLVFYAVALLRMTGGFVDVETFAEVTRQSYFATLARRLVEFAVPIASLFAASRIIGAPAAVPARGVADTDDEFRGSFRGFSIAFLILFYAVALLYLSREGFTVLRVFAPGFRWAVVTLVMAAFAAHLLVWRKTMRADLFRILVGASCAVIVAQWLFFGWTCAGGLWELGLLCLEDSYRAATAFPRLTSTLACLLILLYARRMLADGAEALALRKWLLRAASALLFVYLTFEVATFFNAYVPGFRKWSVSMVWGGYGLALLLWGLNFNGRVSRMAGLVLFAVTLGKVFLSDLSGSDMLYRLIAFAVLGGVLLLAAYAYLRKQDVFKSSDP